MTLKNKFMEKEESGLLILCILKGLSNKDIAQKLNYSRSCIAYKINKLFNKANARNRTDFIVQTLGKIINSKKNELADEIEKSEKLYEENMKLKKILKKISENGYDKTD